jgi:hypothetical protein
MVGDGGKGSSPRLKRDDAAYASNWDKIFGKKDKKDELERCNDDSGQSTGGTIVPALPDKRSTDAHG